MTWRQSVQFATAIPTASAVEALADRILVRVVHRQPAILQRFPINAPHAEGLRSHPANWLHKDVHKDAPQAV